MNVIDLARKSEMTTHVVRYYARIGLLKPGRNPHNGYKVFRRSDVTRLRFIRQAQSLGFTLEEIAQILHDSEHGKSPCPRVRDILRRRIAENHQKLLELTRLQQRMEEALRQWEGMPDGSPSGESVCHLIESAQGPESAHLGCP